MKPIGELLSELRGQGVKLWVEDGDRLRYKAPKGTLTEDMRNNLRDRKIEIIKYLNPLSFGQERLWLLEQLAPGSPVYNVPIAFDLEGPFQVDLLERCINEILRRHEILRTTFTSKDGQPVRIVSPEVVLKLPVVDLQELPEPEREMKAQNLTFTEVRQPFDLAKAPLLRVKLLHLAPQQYVLLLIMHHLVSDGWSLGVFMEELAAIYKAFSAGESSPLPELPLQYVDFALSQRQSVSEEVLETQLEYWKQHLGGSISKLQLPIDKAPPTFQSYAGGYESLVLSEELYRAIEKLSKQEKVSLFATLLAAFQTLLYQYTGQEDIVVCSPFVGRNKVAFQKLIGYFNNILPMRANLEGDPSFRELMVRMHQVLLEAFKNQDVPFEKIATLPSLASTPLSQTLFFLRPDPSQSILPGLNASSLNVHNGTANFDLFFTMKEKGEQLTGVLEYKQDLFEAKTIKQMLGNFQTLLESIVANPELHIQSLPSFKKTAESMPARESGLVDPRDDVEIQLAKIWEKLLGIEPIGVKDNFFELGGHSILAARLFVEIEKTFAKKLPLSTLARAKKLDTLASFIRDDKGRCQIVE